MNEKCSECSCLPTVLVSVSENESLCVSCARETIQTLRSRRYQLADVLGYKTNPTLVDGESIDLTPRYKALITEVKSLVEMKQDLNCVRRFLSMEGR